jgi:hypothetical protein
MIKRPRSLLSRFRKNKRLRTTTDHYIYEYNLNNSERLIGTFGDNNDYAHVDNIESFNKNTLLIGGNGSGRIHSILGQIHRSLEFGHGGLIMLSLHDTFIDEVTEEILSSFNQQNKVVSLRINDFSNPNDSTNHIDIVKEIDFDELVSSNKILIVDGTSNNTNLEHIIVSSYFSALISHYRKNHKSLKNPRLLSPFMCLDSIQSISPTYLKNNIEQLSFLVGLNTVLSYDDVLYKDDINNEIPFLFHSFENKHVMKIQNPDLSEYLIKMFRMECAWGVDSNKIAALKPGISYFVHKGKTCGLRMNYLAAIKPEIKKT